MERPLPGAKPASAPGASQPMGAVGGFWTTALEARSGGEADPSAGRAGRLQRRHAGLRHGVAAVAERAGLTRAAKGRGALQVAVLVSEVDWALFIQAERSSKVAAPVRPPGGYGRKPSPASCPNADPRQHRVNVAFPERRAGLVNGAELPAAPPASPPTSGRLGGWPWVGSRLRYHRCAHLSSESGYVHRPLSVGTHYCTKSNGAVIFSQHLRGKIGEGVS